MEANALDQSAAPVDVELKPQSMGRSIASNCYLAEFAMLESFTKWWCSPRRRGVDSPFAAAELAWKACARTDARRVKELESALSDVLEMLEEWDSSGVGLSGFGGFGAVNRAERLLGRELSEVH